MTSELDLHIRVWRTKYNKLRNIDSRTSVVLQRLEDSFKMIASCGKEGGVVVSKVFIVDRLHSKTRLILHQFCRSIYVKWLT